MRPTVKNFDHLLDRDAIMVMCILGVIAIATLAASSFAPQAIANASPNISANISPRAADEAMAAMDEGRRTAPPHFTNGKGGLILRSAPDQAGGIATDIPAIRLGTDIVAHVSGTSARVTVTQAFRNSSSEWMEAIYLYPLPDNGAVDTLKMVVGDRIIEGQIKPKQEARQIYDAAKSSGRKAGLVEQNRLNMFRNSIANVGPGETVLVQIEFQAPTAQIAGDYALRLPLVVGPRYIAGDTNSDGSLTRAAALAGAADILAPTADPQMAARAGGGLNPVSITVHLDPGFATGAISSPYHAVNVAGEGAQRTVTLADGAVPADRDFELRWSAQGNAPSLGLFRERHGELTYVMATITPPKAQRSGEAPPREMIFVIDNSGSMAGTSMPAAKASLLYALDTLRPQDRFNIIRFDNTMEQLFDSAVAANRRNIEQAKGFTRTLEAEGGTQMLPALRAALDETGICASREAQCGASPTPDAVRQIIFLTDGALSNEADMMRAIEQDRGQSRVFMVGIGSAPNTYLMRRMAQAGRGTFTHVGTGNEAERQMQRLLDRLAQPIATGLSAHVEGGNIAFTPRDLPDLYAGEPLVLLGRTRHLSGTLRISGTIDGLPWQRSIDLTHAHSSAAIAKLWARSRIAEVEAERWSGQTSHERADTSIEELGMDFGLVTSRTSLVAVDATPDRPAGAPLMREELPLLLPAGWDFERLFGGSSADGTDHTGDLAAMRKARREAMQRRARLNLPRGSTGYVLTLGAGLALMLAGLGLGLWWRRARWAVRPARRCALSSGARRAG